MITQVSLRLPYLIFDRLLNWLMLLGRAFVVQDTELLVGRHEVAVLHRTNPRPRLNRADRVVFAALFTDDADARARTQYLEQIISELPINVSEHCYLQGPVLLRVSRRLTRTHAAECDAASTLCDLPQPS
jgi:hypothetical protein